MPDLLFTVGANVQEFLTAIDSSGDKIAALSKHVNQDANGALQTFGVNLGALSNPLTLVAGGMKAAIDTTTRFANEIDDLQRVTGGTAQETSTLLTVLGDYGVGLGTIKTAAKSLKDEGLTPNLTTLKELAKQYQAIQDPAERTRFGTEKLGRAYFDLSEILSKKTEEFDALAAAAERSGKAMSQEQVDRVQAFSLQLEQLKDKGEGVLLTVGPPLVSTLSTAISSLENYAGIWQAVGIKIGLATGQLTESEAAMQASILAGKPLAQVTATVGDSFDHATKPVRELSKAATTYELAAREAAAASAESAAKADFAKEAAGRLAQSINDAAAAQKELNEKNRDWIDNTADDLKQALEDAGVKGAEFEQALLATDQTLGSSLFNQDEYHQKLAAITEEYAKSGLVATYKAQVADLQNEFSPQKQQDLENQVRHLGLFNDELGKVHDVHATVTLDVVQNGTIPTAVGGSGAPITNPAAGEAGLGGSETGTPGSAGNVTPGEETIVPGTGGAPGQQDVRGSSGGITIYIDTINVGAGASGKQTAHDLLAEFGKQARLATASGAGHSGVN